jgi:hypothetical protein
MFKRCVRVPWDLMLIRFRRCLLGYRAMAKHRSYDVLQWILNDFGGIAYSSRFWAGVPVKFGLLSWFYSDRDFGMNSEVFWSGPEYAHSQAQRA